MAWRLPTLTSAALLIVFTPALTSAQPRDGNTLIRGLDPSANGVSAQDSHTWKADDLPSVRRVNAVLDDEGSSVTAAERATLVAKALQDFLDDTDDMREELEERTRDGVLDEDDMRVVYEEAGRRVKPDEMLVLREARDGRLYDDDRDFSVTDEAKAALGELVDRANMKENSLEDLEVGYTYAGTRLPDAVQRLKIEMKLAGAEPFDPDEGDDWSDYPSTTRAEGTMDFPYTEVTPASLLADLEDREPHLRVVRVDEETDVKVKRISGSGTVSIGDFKITRFRWVNGGSGEIWANNSQLAGYHSPRHNPFRSGRIRNSEGRMLPIRWEGLYTAVGVPADHTPFVVQAARGLEGNKWSNNCAILDDFSFHCLPALRNHVSSGGLVLTNPALGRNHKLLWNGHISIRLRNGKPTVTSISTSGRVGKNVARGKVRSLINPVPLIRAWFEGNDEVAVSDNLRITHDHADKPINGELTLNDNPSVQKHQVRKALKRLRR